MKLFQAIRDRDMRQLKSGDYKPDRVEVFCGSGRGDTSVRELLQIANTVAFTFPTIEIGDMTVREIQKHESSYHAGMIAVSIVIPTEEVLRNLSKYTTL